MNKLLAFFIGSPDTRVPLTLVLIVLAICISPALLNLLGIDFSTATHSIIFTEDMSKQHLLIEHMFTSLRGAFTHTILEWSAFSIAIITAILALAHYRISKDITIPIIGIALFMAGCMDAFHTLAADRLITAVADNKDLIPFTWAMSRVFNALIMIVGISILLLRFRKGQAKPGLYFIIGISAMFGIIAYFIIHYSATSMNLPNTTFPDALLTRPYDAVPLLLFIICGLFIYPVFYRRFPSLFAHALLLSAIPEIVTQLHMTFGSTALFDNHFNIAHFMKIVAYAVPLMGLILDYLRGQQLLQQEIEERKEIEQIKNEFISTVSHELRTPLTAIRGSLGLLTGEVIGKLPDKAHELLSIADNNAQRLLLLINDILDMEKIESGKMQFNFKTLSVAELIKDAVTSNASYADRFNVKLIANYATSPSYIHADHTRMMQVMSNLISNAIKFSPEESSVIVSFQQQDEAVHISVSDEGEGIPESFHNNLFSKFTQAENINTRNHNGTGLGLSISKSIIEEHGGSLSYYNHEGKGCTFYIDIKTVLPPNTSILEKN